MSIISKALGFVGRVFGFKPGPDVTPLVRSHWVPPPTSREAWLVGPERCFRCHVSVYDVKLFAKPCPGRPPEGVELA